jgi:hypothetical protein
MTISGQSTHDKHEYYELARARHWRHRVILRGKTPDETGASLLDDPLPTRQDKWRKTAGRRSADSRTDSCDDHLFGRLGQQG